MFLTTIGGVVALAYTKFQNILLDKSMQEISNLSMELDSGATGFILATNMKFTRINLNPLEVNNANKQ